MDRRTKICIWIILVGLANFLVYTILYMFIGPGEAVNGHLEIVRGETRYILQSGHEVSRGLYVYSGIHSISVWPTVGAVVLAMLTLAKDRIISSMHSTVVRGRTLITILATVITMIVLVMTIWFTLQFCRSFARPHVLPDAAALSRASSEAPRPAGGDAWA